LQLWSWYVDGEFSPWHSGKGTEDYCGYAWGIPARFEAPFHAQTVGGPNNGAGQGTQEIVQLDLEETEE